MAERPSDHRRPRPGPYNTPRSSAGSGPSSASGSSRARLTPTRLGGARPGSLGGALSGSPMTRSSSFPERTAASQPSFVRPQAASAHLDPMPSSGTALPSGTAFQPWYVLRNQADAHAFIQQQPGPYTIFPPSFQGGATSQPIAGQQTVTNLTSVKLKRQKVLDSNGHETGQVVMMETDLQRAMASLYVNTSLGAPPLPAGIPWGGPIEGVWQGPNTTATASYPAGGYTTSTQQGNRPSNVGSQIPAGASGAPAQPTRSFRAHPSAQIASVDTTAIPASSSHDIPRRPRSVVSNAPSTPDSTQTPGTQYWGGNYMGSPSTFQSPVQGRTPPMHLFNRGLGSGVSAINPSNPTAESSATQRAVRAPTANKVEESEGEENTISKPYPTKPRSLSMDSVVSGRSRLMEDVTGGRGGPSTGIPLAYDPSTGHIRVVSDGEVFFMPPMTEEEERSIFHLKPREERQ